ncbi:MAG: sigma-70 family RNA polymerase sigma factor [Anaerolineae bacterium]
MADTTTTDEQALIRAAQRGDRNAFNLLVLRYQDGLYTLAYRIMGETQSAADAAQEAFITAFRRLSTYRGGSFRGWLIRIATNICYDELRRRKRRPVVAMEDLVPPESDDDAPIPDPSDTPEQAMQQRELNRAIQDCINALGEDQRVVLILSDVEGLSYQEIADNTNAQVGTVKSRLSRARASVRNCLQAVEELLPGAYRLME